ncbi:PREDICTED: similar to predicted protein [Bathycoccus prasinos]|uniref:Uncharacterized protein n=1 Tax=Bathycoccus prasinos TaxID=41875 RepID=K8ENJ3_9CHLO|nr:PREDICTED: similar to predicted protein [Bathycoccus prasinos]CCO13995.1 PREDICTED: similar to predicted protein [Bathycoccus prasinos]|eukprot:XP_007515116.1 PREDICTED: similar to predicted protein [Bathycoccus prasinos]
MTRNEQSERDVGENLAEARALCERLDETLKNCASKLVGDVSTRRVTELEERVKEMEEEMREVKEELRNLSPTPLWKVVTDKQYKDIFETHILSKLDDLSFRVFREVNTESRDACRRSGRKLRETFGLTTYSGNPPVTKKTTIKIEGKEAQRYFCSEAARMGNLALVRWLREVKKFDWNELTINEAAENGHLHIVTYCTEQKCPRGSLPCACAAKSGHLDILKYLHENGAPWNLWTCTFARKNNHLECLNYAKENGCQNDTHVPQH